MNTLSSLKLRSYIISIFCGLLVMTSASVQGMESNDDADLATIREQLKGHILSSEVQHDGRIDLEVLETPELIETLTTEGQWPDIDYTKSVASAWYPNMHLSRLLQLAHAYALPGGAFYEDPAVLDAAQRALHFWVKKPPMSRNWFHNDISGPRKVGYTLLLLGDDVSSEDFEKGILYLQRARVNMTGQNRIWLAINVLIRGALTNDAAAVIEARDAITENIAISLEEGLQPDWSYHLHGPQLMTGAYGLAFARTLSEWMPVLHGTPYAFPEEKIVLLRNYVLKGLGLTVWKGTMDISAGGRALFPGKLQSKREEVREIIQRMAQADPEYREDYARLWYASDDGASFENKATGNFYYWRSDYLLDRRESYMASLKMHSERVTPTEEINKENRNGTYLGDGALYLYRTGREYEDIFAVWDWRKLPGTTALNKTNTHTKKNPFNQQSFVGGVSDGQDGLAVMDLKREIYTIYNRDAKGVIAYKKSWFFLPGCIVVLGADLTADYDPPLENYYKLTTTLNQSLLNGPVFVARGGQAPVELKSHQRFDDLNWAWHDAIGYVLLDQASVEVGPETKTGSWKGVYAAGPEGEVTQDVFSMWIDHAYPADTPRRFAYALLPDVSMGNMADRFRQLDLEVLVNSEAQQAVRCGALTMVSFHQAGRQSVGGQIIQVDQPCLLMLRQSTSGDVLTVSDPTQKLSELTVTIGDRSIPVQLPTDAGRAGRSIAIAVD